MLDPFQLPFAQRGMLEVLALSVGAGLLGTWIVLRGLAFFSHAVGAAAFPGLVLADGLGFAAPLGALAAGLVFAVGVGGLSAGRHGRYDNVTALVLTGALALGVLLASDVFHSGTNVDTLLFGSLFLIEPRDVVVAVVASAVALGASMTFGRVWLASGFDPEGLRALGVRAGGHDAALLVLVAILVVASLSAIGALLAAALLVVPAATTRLWANRVLRWQAATVALTAVEGVAGVWLSVQLNAPPGATIATLAGSVLALAGVLPACGDRSDGGANGRVRVVATTTQIGDWVRQVGGDAVEVHQILRANTDPHEYEPRPADVQSVADASVVFTNGDGLDGWAGKLVDEAGGDPDVVDLAVTVRAPLPGASSGPERSTFDPHWWHDPVNAIAAVSRIEAALARVRPSASASFAARAQRYERRLAALDREIRSCLDRLPARSRRLVTDHDGFGYFARRYGLDVVGAVIPSQATQAQPSARDLSRLADVVRREHVPAIFPERSLSPKLAQTIARETGAAAGLELYGDALGPAGSGAGTYAGMEATNARTIALGLSAGRVRCTIPDG